MLSCALLKLWWYLYIGELNLSTFRMQHLAISNRFPISRSALSLSFSFTFFLPSFVDDLEMSSLNVYIAQASASKCVCVLFARSTHTFLSMACFWSEVHRLAWIICIYIHHSIGLQQFHFSMGARVCVYADGSTHQIRPPETKPNKRIKYVDWTQLIANVKLSTVNIQWDLVPFQSIITLDNPLRLHNNKL